jgi:hypothetical protein
MAHSNFLSDGSLSSLCAREWGCGWGSSGGKGGGGVMGGMAILRICPFGFWFVTLTDGLVRLPPFEKWIRTVGRLGARAFSLLLGGPLPVASA